MQLQFSTRLLQLFSFIFLPEKEKKAARDLVIGRDTLKKKGKEKKIDRKMQGRAPIIVRKRSFRDSGSRIRRCALITRPGRRRRTNEKRGCCSLLRNSHVVFSLSTDLGVAVELVFTTSWPDPHSFTHSLHRESFGYRELCAESSFPDFS